MFCLPSKLKVHFIDKEVLLHMCVFLGSCGVHLEMSVNNSRALKFYLKLGFVTLDFACDSTADDVLILGRTL